MVCGGGGCLLKEGPAPHTTNIHISTTCILPLSTILLLLQISRITKPTPKSPYRYHSVRSQHEEGKEARRADLIDEPCLALSCLTLC